MRPPWGKRMRPLTPALLDVAPRVERRRRRTHRIDGEDLVGDGVARDIEPAPATLRVVPALEQQALGEIGRASCRERVCQYVYISGVAGSLKKKTHTHKQLQ